MSIKAKRPDIIYVSIYQKEGIIVPELVTELGIADIPIIFCSLAKPSPVIGAFKTKFAKNYLSYFEMTTGEKPGELSLLGADAYLFLIDAINRAKSTEPSRIREALAYTRGFEGITGPINIVEDRNTIKDFPIVKLEKGKFETVTIIPFQK